MSDLGKTKAYSEALSVYNILRYSKRTMCKELHEKILHILLAGRLLKDAYVVIKVFQVFRMNLLWFSNCIAVHIHDESFPFQDNATFISQPAIKKFATAYMKSGNINMLNDVVKTLHGCGHKIDKVNQYSSV